MAQFSAEVINNRYSNSDAYSQKNRVIALYLYIYVYNSGIQPDDSMKGQNLCDGNL